MNANNSTPANRHGITRRDAMKGGAAIIGGTVATAGYSSYPAQAIPPLIVAGAAAAGVGIAVGWAAREITMDNAAKVEETKEKEIRNTIRRGTLTRQSVNDSTFVDNQNILEGIDHVAFGEAKVAAIEKINDGAAKSEVETAAHDAVVDHINTVMKNLLKSWNESLSELQNFFDTVQNNGNLNEEDFWAYIDSNGNVQTMNRRGTGSHSYTLPDGNTMTVKTINAEFSNNAGDAWYDFEYSATQMMTSHLDISDNDHTIFYHGDVADPGGSVSTNPLPDSVVEYLGFEDWNSLVTTIENKESNLKSEMTTWVDTAYSQVQEGEINPDDLVTPKDIASYYSDQEDTPRAIADLQALNLPVDLEREATIKVDRPNYELTLSGSLAVPDGTTIEAGKTYDPETDFSTDPYITYHVDDGTGKWTAVEDGINGGVVTFTAEPVEDTVYTINTTDGESVEVTRSDFTENSGNYEVDLSGSLENDISTVAQVDMDSPESKDGYRTIALADPFEVIQLVNEETGEEADKAEYSTVTTHDDSNYLTQEDWDELKQQQQAVIDSIEDTGGGGGGSGETGSSSNYGILAALGAAAAAAYALLGGDE